MEAADPGGDSWILRITSRSVWEDRVQSRDPLWSTKFSSTFLHATAGIYDASEGFVEAILAVTSLLMRGEKVLNIAAKF